MFKGQVQVSDYSRVYLDLRSFGYGDFLLKAKGKMMTADAKKNLAIGLLTLCCGFSLLSLGYLWMGEGPAGPPSPEELEKTQPRAAVPHEPSKSSVPDPPSAPLLTAQVPAPIYDWVQTRKEGFVLQPGQKAMYGPIDACDGPCQPWKPHLIRFAIKSSSPVDAGALDGVVATGQQTNEQIFSNYFGSPVTLCYTPQTLQSDHTCRLTGEQKAGYVLIRDARGNSAIPAVVARMAGIKSPLETQLKENRVSITFWQWRCVRFCPAGVAAQ